MKIATYNIWDSDAGMPARFQQITNEIMKTDADIICLQEVDDREKHNRISAHCGYEYSHWQAQTGLSILSRYPMENVSDFEYGTSACIQLESWQPRSKLTGVLTENHTKTLLIINVHLPWESVVLREKVIVDVVKSTAGTEADLTFLVGDFNSSADSSVHRFLTNEQSLLGSDAYFFDLAEIFAEMTGIRTPDTLNFRENPRWGVVQPENTIEVNQRFDWILLKNPYPAEFPVLKYYTVFGMEVSEKTHLAASDHYGVMAELG